MTGLIARRLAALIPMLFIVTLLTFLMAHASTDPVQTIVGGFADQETYDAMEQELGYDRPLPVQYVDWLSGVVQGDFGTSYRNQDRPVGEVILQRLPVTLAIAAAAMLLTTILGVGLGLFGGTHPGSRTDRVVSTIASASVAVPGFWFAMILILIFSLRFSWFPATGWTSFSDDPAQWARGLVLPTLAVALAGIGTIARLTQTATTMTLGQDYVRTARAKGLPRWRITTFHMLQNVLIPVVPIIALQAAILFSGTIIVEQIFALPGLGQLAFDSAQSGDIPMIQGVVILTAVTVTVATLMGDILLGILNPKVRVA